MSTLTFQAESVAFTVCQHYGIDTGDYSFVYVAGWSHGKETPELKASLDKIRRTASEMITAIDGHLEALKLEQEKENAPQHPTQEPSVDANDTKKDSVLTLLHASLNEKPDEVRRDPTKNAGKKTPVKDFHKKNARQKKEEAR